MFNTYYLFAGNQVHFLTKAGQGDPDYKDFWDRHESETEDTTYKNIDDGLGLLLNDRIIMHVNDQSLRSFFNSNPFFHQKLRYLARQKQFFGGVITTKNSPLWPIFKKGATLLRERSLTDKIIKAWVGKELKATTEVEKMVVGAGQVVLVILVMGAAILMLTVMMLEEKSINAPVHQV